jgi:serine/threonine-protein kinase
MSGSGPIPVREGDLLAGKYRVQRVLGVGGMGVVVAACHEQLQQNVAIKFVRSEALDNAEAVARFLNEARAAVKLKSEHAAKVLDVGTLDTGAPFMVMELLEGSDLATVLGERGPLPIELAAEYIVQACEAVAEAHAAGIVHRDLKPQNLFLARTVGGTAKVKVLDFGVSKSLALSGEGALTRTRSMLGSPLYMSPEQMRSSRDVDARSDVWALGVVLFHLLTMRWPFEAETMPELCLKVVSEPPIPLSALRPEVPASMVAVVERCLVREPERRFANAAELAAALAPFAPHGSRLAAERARLVISAAASTQVAPSGVPEAGGRRSGPTPTSWGAAQGTPAVPAARASAGVWIAVAAIGAAAAAGGVLLAHGLSRRHAEPGPAPPSSLSPPSAPSALSANVAGEGDTPPSSPGNPSLAPAASLEAPAGAASTTGGASTATGAASTVMGAASIRPADSASASPSFASGATATAGGLAVGRPRAVVPRPATPPGAPGADGRPPAGAVGARSGKPRNDDDIPSMR